MSSETSSETSSVTTKINALLNDVSKDPRYQKYIDKTDIEFLKDNSTALKFLENIEITIPPIKTYEPDDIILSKEIENFQQKIAEIINKYIAADIAAKIKQKKMVAELIEEQKQRVAKLKQGKIVTESNENVLEVFSAGGFEPEKNKCYNYVYSNTQYDNKIEHFYAEKKDLGYAGKFVQKSSSGTKDNYVSKFTFVLNGKENCLYYPEVGPHLKLYFRETECTTGGAKRRRRKTKNRKNKRKQRKTKNRFYTF